MGNLGQQKADDGCQTDSDEGLRPHRLLELCLKLHEPAGSIGRNLLAFVHQAGHTLLRVLADIGYATFRQLRQGARNRGNVAL